MTGPSLAEAAAEAAEAALAGVGVQDGRGDRVETQEHGPGGPRRSLPIFDVLEVVRRVEAAGPPRWLIQDLWPAGAYGVLGAEDKAGKTWAGLDLAVSVATGSSWLGRFPCHDPGPVLAFLGEGGERAIVRRLRAITASRGAELEDLAGRVRLCFAVPRLADRRQLAKVEVEIAEHPPRAVLFDPLYLAAAGVKGSDLYAMGDVLGGIQRVVQEAGASLTIVTHWNKGGTGRGPERFTGVGPGAWGRVLGSGAVERRGNDAQGGTSVQLRWAFRGSEIPDRTFRMVRDVRAEDPEDLASALTYRVEVTEAEVGPVAVAGGLSPSRVRVLAVLAEAGPLRTARHIGDALAVDGQGPPLKPRTIQEALQELEGLGLVEGSAVHPGTARYWAVV